MPGFAERGLAPHTRCTPHLPWPAAASPALGLVLRPTQPLRELYFYSPRNAALGTSESPCPGLGGEEVREQAVWLEAGVCRHGPEPPA